MTAGSTIIPKIRTFKMTAWEVTDKINSILKSNPDSKVLKVTTPENGCSTLSIELSYGIFLDELIEISEFFGDETMLISSFNRFDGISLYIQPNNSLWQEEGGAQ